MTPSEATALSERLRAHVEQMANTSWGLTMQEWNVISNDILSASRALAALSAETWRRVESTNPAALSAPALSEPQQGLPLEEIDRQIMDVGGPACEYSGEHVETCSCEAGCVPLGGAPAVSGVTEEWSQDISGAIWSEIRSGLTGHFEARFVQHIEAKSYEMSSAYLDECARILTRRIEDKLWPTPPANQETET